MSPNVQAMLDALAADESKNLELSTIIKQIEAAAGVDLTDEEKAEFFRALADWYLITGPRHWD